ncbi:hypothetical protein [Marinobacter shengliensis]|uniref:hypothetical protein n=1 Tax=Marinobacter shengliensis TaxID=1389223 RepID=UPI0011084EEF|nr:hypothetical protein [Marinobacter shengliensis]
MLIESKAQFNSLAAQFSDGIADYSPKPIRASKIREMLAKAIGFKSHNGLLSQLPIDAQCWAKSDALERLSHLLKSHDGIKAPVTDIIAQAIDRGCGINGQVQCTSQSRTIEDYAFSRTADYDGKTVICLTPLGRKVYEECMALHDSIPLISIENLERWEEAMLRLIDRHPANPWPKAMYCYCVAPSFWQANWCEALPHHPEKGFMPDAEEGFREYAGSYGDELLPIATTAIEQFEKWLGPNAKTVAEHNLISENAETFYWPAILYIGGMIALNSGEDRLAKRWLGLNLKLVAQDNFGARYGLSVLRLNDGKGSVRSLFPQDSACAWGWLARALDALVRGNTDKAVQNFLLALKYNYGVCEAFGQPLRERKQIRIMSNHAAPAFIQEFMFRTLPFWKAHPEAKSFFGAICRDPYVQVRVEDYHVHRSEGIGSAFKTAEFRIEHERRAGELWEGVSRAVASASRNARPWP